MAFFFQILSAIVALFLGLYYYFTSTYGVWKRRGVPGPQPIPIFGNMKDVILRKDFVGEFVARLYREYPHEPMVGIFMKTKPALVLRDLDLIKNVLIRDFAVFDHRGIPLAEKAEPLSAHLFNLEGARWRPLRSRLSPVFTSGRIKEMFPLMMECSKNLKKYVEAVVEKGEPGECHEIAGRFTTDVIGSCVFGINMNALSDEESEFRKIGRDIFDTDTRTPARVYLREFLPGFYNLLGYILPSIKRTRFLTRVITDTISYREKNNVVRPDFINMLMELKRHPEKLEGIELNDYMLAAQAFVFFAAGFETSSTTIAHALYELALNPDVQDKLREELKEASARNNGNLKYDDIREMKYLDKVFKETLRKYPPGTQVRRVCIRDYVFDGTKISIPKGTTVFIPLYGIQNDPDIYPNPNTFDPERFNEDAIAARHPMAYLPFGDGPRSCIGERFAYYQTKLGLIKMLENFKVEPCEKTMIPYEHSPKGITLTPKYGIYLKISKVEVTD